MAVTYIEVDTSLLDSDVRELNASITSAKKSLDALREELEALHSMWTGRASMTFRATATKDCNAMEKMLEEIDKLSGCMTNAGREYVRCENQVNELVRDIRV